MKPFHMYWAYQDRIEPAHHSYVMYACEQMADEGVDDATCSDLLGNGEDYANDRTMDAGPRVGRDVAQGEPDRTRTGSPDETSASEAGAGAGCNTDHTAPGASARIPVGSLSKTDQDRLRFWQFDAGNEPDVLLDRGLVGCEWDLATYGEYEWTRPGLVLCVEFEEAWKAR